MLQEIIPDVFTWSWFSEPHGYNFNGFLFCLPEGNLCVDPPEADEEALEEISRRGVARILLTNRNHVRAANRVRERTGAKVAIHPDDAAYARGQGAKLDEELRVGEKVGPLRVLGVPGKSPGEVALFWPERRVLLVGDAIVGHPPGRCGLLREGVMDDPPRLRESIRRLLDLDFDVLLVGDGESILGRAKEKVRELVEGFPKP